MKTKKTTNKKTAPKNLTVLEEVKQLYKFMEDNKLSALDYANKGTHVKLVRAGMAQSVEGTLNNFSFQPKEETKKEVPVYGATVKSPLQGIFFRGASPSAPPFIREGDKVKAGTPICLIEAMKVFNEVKAPFDCVITKVLIDNGQPVKQGDMLFGVEKI